MLLEAPTSRRGSARQHGARHERVAADPGLVAVFVTNRVAVVTCRAFPHFRCTNAVWNLNSVAGLMSAPSFGIRRGGTDSVVSPSTKRSIDVRLGARHRERL